MIDIAILQANSSHPEAFIGIVNGPDSALAGRARVSRVWDEDPAAAEAAATLGVVACPDLDEAVADADLVMICGRWGKQHPDLAIDMAARRIPTFIDKPMAVSFDRAMDVVRAFEASRTPALSASAYRFAPEVLDFVRGLGAFGPFRSGHAAGLSEWAEFGPLGVEPYFYAVHVAEMVQAVFGSGVDTLTLTPGEHADIAHLEFPDGRRVAWHLLRDCAEVYEVSFFGRDGHGNVRIDPDSPYYESMLDATVTMAETGESPLALGQSAEIVAMLDAVVEARHAPGRAIRLQSAGAAA